MNCTWSCLCPDVHYLSFFNTIQKWVPLSSARLIPFCFIWLGNYGAALRRSVVTRIAVWFPGLLDHCRHTPDLARLPCVISMNSLAGLGTDTNWLGDSNLDWGQDLKELEMLHGSARHRPRPVELLRNADPRPLRHRLRISSSAKQRLRPSPACAKANRHPVSSPSVPISTKASIFKTRTSTGSSINTPNDLNWPFDPVFRS